MPATLGAVRRRVYISPSNGAELAVSAGYLQCLTMDCGKHLHDNLPLNVELEAMASRRMRRIRKSDVTKLCNFRAMTL
jgi:hypothetical protein